MQFTPKSEKEIQEENLLPKGLYDAEVFSAEETTSKNGNAMMVVKMRVFKPSGGETRVTDYLLESIAYKLRHFAHAIGLGANYDAGELDADDCVRRSCQVEIGIDDKNKDYPAKNVIKDYIAPDGDAKSVAKSEPKSIPKAAHDPSLDVEDDEIPFN